MSARVAFCDSQNTLRHECTDTAGRMIIPANAVLVACEYSQMVTTALRRRGIPAFSCDLRATEGNPDFHIQHDAVEIAYRYPWAGMIAHPECTHLTLAGARWFYDPRFPNKHSDREKAIKFWLKLKAAPIKRKAFENPQPLGYVMERIGRYTQKFQPSEFGDAESKAICLWLEELPPLLPTHSKHGDLFTLPAPKNIVSRVWRMPPGPERAKERSRFFPGVANAMADQWLKYFMPSQLARPSAAETQSSSAISA